MVIADAEGDEGGDYNEDGEEDEEGFVGFFLLDFAGAEEAAAQVDFGAGYWTRCLRRRI